MKLSTIWKNNAVFQCGKPIRIKGQIDKCAERENGIELIAELTGADGICISKGTTKLFEGDSSFLLSLPAVPAQGPCRLKVSGGDELVEIEGLYAGEVFLCGGQSNMELTLAASANGEEEAARAYNPRVRFFATPKFAYSDDSLHEFIDGAQWQNCEPGIVRDWTAIGYYFAQEIAADRNCMVGIISCNWGGTSASCWVPREDLAGVTSLVPYLDAYDRATAGLVMEEYLKELEEYTVYQAEFDRKVGEYYTTAENPTWEEAIALCGENRYPGPMGPRNFTRPAGLYQSMLSLIAPYSLAGVLYYQGEEDDNRPYTYETLLKVLIKRWRYDFEDSGLPFFLVQLPVFRNEGEDDYGNWPFIREAQYACAKEDDNVNLAVILELGEDCNIHPLDKKTVAHRLALQARYKLYNSAGEEEAFGPEVCSVLQSETGLVVSFIHAPGGLVNKDPGNVLGNFEIAGIDGVYMPADIKAEENRIILSSSSCEHPVCCRYFWRNYGTPTLFGTNGIPVSPFRSYRLDGTVARKSRQGEILDEG